MKRFLCIMFCFAILLGLCGCQNTKNDLSSETVKVIYEEEVEILDDYTSSAIQSGVSNVTSEVESKPNTNSSENISTNSESESLGETGWNIYSLNEEQTLKSIKLNGRCNKTSDGVGLDFAASAIEFNTDASAAMVVVNATEGIYYNIMIDGEFTSERQLTQNGTNYIILARGLSSGSHNIKLIRDCESRSNLKFELVNLQLDSGVLLNKDEDKPIIEFLGDSLTNGYGNLIQKGASNASDLKNQSVTKAYSYLLASKLNMDYRIVSMSGIALGKREGYPTFPEFYALESYHLDKEKKYTSSNPADVDVVVVNLGTNDASDKLYNEKDSQSVENYGKRYAELITNIGYEKDVKIVFVSGVSWCHTQTVAYNKAKEELKSLGYNNMYSIDIRSLQSGGGGHPSAMEHAEVADTLFKFIKDNNIA